MGKNKRGFKGGMPGGGMNPNMIMQAQRKMQEELQRIQEEAESQTYSAQAGGGAVTAVVSGKRELTSIKISPDAVDPGDVDMLEDLIVAAVNEALRSAEESMSQSMAKLTGGLGLGGLGL